MKKKICLAAALLAVAVGAGSVGVNAAFKDNSNQVKAQRQIQAVSTVKQTAVREHRYCDVAGCTLTEEHQHGACGVDGCTKAGEHNHERKADCPNRNSNQCPKNRMRGANGGTHHSARRGHHQ